MDSAAHTIEGFQLQLGVARPWIYRVLLAACLGALASLPLIEVDLAVRASGNVRPATERVELRTTFGGQIRRVLALDNDRVAAGQPLLELESSDLDERLALNRVLGRRNEILLADLTLLAELDPAVPAGAPAAIRSPAAQQEYAQLLAQLEANRIAEAKARTELDRAAALAAKGIAPQRELDDARFALERTQAEARLILQQSRTRWQSRLRDEQAVAAALASEEKRLREERTRYTLCAPVAGTVQGLVGLAPGANLTPGQVVGLVSPDDRLVLELQVSPRDIGQIRPGQPAKIQIDAFPYTQWGLLDGTVQSVGADSLATRSAPDSSQPIRVLVTLAATTLRLPGGFVAEIRKGMTATARLHLARRSLLQVLYQNARDQLDPRAA